jgi:hypothetical protein
VPSSSTIAFELLLLLLLPLLHSPLQRGSQTG